VSYFTPFCVADASNMKGIGRVDSDTLKRTKPKSNLSTIFDVGQPNS